ncbi:hypothetical protein SNE510_16780 [Streptomyces sp. NE5-10]|uniref:hypothetical protein n=1 Tax=Streptomyces sp. NE5-10 TaxID=2759674 RepID=UPI001903920F|nr:hypothetical protein [Streptomyces sp. NE5-10]GHJ92159.1 hypothetical protein SNE510_16780 [Streptomyces sp. NE5-10]
MPFSLPAGGRLAVLALSLAVTLGSAPAAADPASPVGPQAPQNPATAANGSATMHGDSASSGITPHPGPGTSGIACSRTVEASPPPFERRAARSGPVTGQTAAHLPGLKVIEPDASHAFLVSRPQAATLVEEAVRETAGRAGLPAGRQESSH